MKKIVLASLLAVATCTTSTVMAQVTVHVTHTEVPSKAPLFTEQLFDRYKLTPEFIDLQEQRLPTDIRNQVLKTSASALGSGKKWFGLNHDRVYIFLDQYPEVKDLVVSYMYRHGITGFSHTPSSVTIQQAVDEELDYDFLSHLWSLNDMKEYIKDQNHPFVIYHKSRLTPNDYSLLEQALNSQSDHLNPNAVTNLKTLIVHGMVLNDLYQRALPVVHIQEGTY